MEGLIAKMQNLPVSPLCCLWSSRSFACASFELWSFGGMKMKKRVESNSIFFERNEQLAWFGNEGKRKRCGT